MSQHTLSKTFLALAITAASASALAVPADLNKDVSGASEVAYSRVSYNNVTLSGNANREADQDGTGFKGATITGDLTNNANVTAHGQFVDALDLDSSDDGDAVPTTVSGNLTNNGNFELSGMAPVGIVTDGATIGGNFVNNGNMSLVGADNTIDSDTPRAIELGNTQIGGDVINTGKLSVSGTGSKGIYAFTSTGTSNLGTIGKDVINKGNIAVSGNDSAGISLEKMGIRI